MTSDYPTHVRRLNSIAIRLSVVLFTAVACFGLGSCASTVKVTAEPERVTQQGLESTRQLRQVVKAPLSVLGAFADASSQLLDNARKLEAKGDKVDAAGNYLMAAVDAHRLLASGTAESGSEAEKALMEIEGAGLARFAELWMEDPRRSVPGPYQLSGGSGRLEAELSKSSIYQKGYFDHFIAAESVEETGMVRKSRPGCGAAMVGIREQRAERAGEMKFYPKRGLHLPVTLTIDSIAKAKTADGATAVKLSMRNPLLEQTVAVGNRRLPLAADFSAPLAVLLKGRKNNRGLTGFFKPEERLKQSGIYLVEPYDPERIPVLLIHGLVSVPIIWRDIIPEMTCDPEISRRYQFMVFAYPSSYPLYQSANLLRENLAALRAKYDPEGKDPLSNNMVVAGHSMGGMLTHTLVADFGDRFWNEISDVPFDQVKMDPQEKEKIRKMVFFSPDPAAGRVVYFSAPHRGAKMAEKGIAGMVSRMAKLPVKVLQTSTDILTAVGSENLKLEENFMKGKVTSVQSLEPGAPMVAAMDASPYKKGVIYHSIIGDRGKSDTPNSSDGVVEYWSSHQDGAASELIVPTDHGSYKSPLAIEELKRILRVHAGIR
ncbi:MAG: pimeloyl-ACP methyl ester carboxylesterase [Verrucomicrobiales bacterium]|jgi:pimeloyl-ACP methyl ester carboxylesterase